VAHVGFHVCRRDVGLRIRPELDSGESPGGDGRATGYLLPLDPRIMQRWWLTVSLIATVGCGDGDGDEAPPVRGEGEIRIAAIDGFFNPGAPRSSIDGWFSRTDRTNHCETTRMGACEVIDCQAPPAATLPRAGTLTVATADDRVNQAIEANEAGLYQFGESTLMFEGGDTVSVTGSGGDVPPFELAAEFPPTFIAVEPMLTASENTLRILHETDTLVRVSGGVAGVELVAQLSGTNAAMRCSAPSEGGELVISAEALAAAGGGVVELRSVTRAHTRAGSYDLSLVMLAGVMQDDGRLLLVTH
jgi:hypothetical protein